MFVPNISDVTLAPVDPALLLCWEETVRQGLDCSLLRKHSKGKVITTSRASRPEAKAPTTALFITVEKKMVQKMEKKKQEDTGGPPILHHPHPLSL